MDEKKRRKYIWAGVQSALMFLQQIRKASCTISKYNARNLKKQVKFKDLPESFVIFITENDVIGDGEKIYHADRIIRETGKTQDDLIHDLLVQEILSEPPAQF